MRPETNRLKAILFRDAFIVAGFIGFLAVLFPGCATAKNDNAKSDKKILDYYGGAPPMEDIYWGIGAGSDMAEASVASIADISRQLKIEIDEETIIRISEATDNGRTVAGTSLTSTARLRSGADLTGVKRLDRKTSLNGTVYTLYYFDAGGSFDPEAVLEEMNRAYKKQKRLKIAATFVLPGTGQLLDREPLKGGLFLGFAAGAAAVLTVGILGMVENNNAYLSSANDSAGQYYYDKWKNARLLTIVGGAVYFVCGAVSAVDFEAGSF